MEINSCVQIVRQLMNLSKEIYSDDYVVKPFLKYVMHLGGWREGIWHFLQKNSTSPPQGQNGSSKSPPGGEYLGKFD